MQLAWVTPAFFASPARASASIARRNNAFKPPLPYPRSARMGQPCLLGHGPGGPGSGPCPVVRRTTTLSWEYDSPRGTVDVEVPEPGLLVGVVIGAIALFCMGSLRRQGRRPIPGGYFCSAFAPCVMNSAADARGIDRSA